MNSSGSRHPSNKDLALKSLAVSRETIERLEIYEALLLKWQKIKNLVAPSTLDQIWSRHFADSAQLVELVPDARKWVDLGSGGGFPGLVVAIQLAGLPGAEVHLVESDNRKCAFLREVARALEAPAIVHHMRIEACYAAVGTVDVVSARALAPLQILLDLSTPFIENGAKCLFLKGQDIDTELTETTTYSRVKIQLIESKTDPSGRIVMVNPARH
ncbi:16S rRNA (guanine(527)-N(7))-methyltransferase RsmG [Roseiarcaceae bacterium H3SJ34-1]|uniref:16S rRNA (guanine(527)-N(7))-methyltransferase RsmG n=1 Tax=Terripilifer ovatus TaxID=3032367 RepID=UPI003AB92D71|nr:16S rRNA (guanine(527)-N(7))-methyltransferase RsmG [Roseiarcaceae bacterium H3SJ34-1]